jgi:choline dehydrogenase-like flavoprotein
VIGASTFPSTSGKNPTQTVQALAWRTGAYVARNIRKIAS